MSDLGAAIGRLEAVLHRIGHPLAEPSNRPSGRSGEQTQEVAEELIGKRLPQELVDLWEWWEKDQNPPESAGPSPFARYLPGGLRIYGLEEAVRIADQRRLAELTSPGSEDWLPVLYQGDEVVLHWCEIPNSQNGKVPVTVADRISVPDEEPIWRTESLANLIHSVAELAEEGFWVDSDGQGWHYTGEYGFFPWLC